MQKIDLNNNKIPQIQYLLKKDVNNVKKSKKITKIIE